MMRMEVRSVQLPRWIVPVLVLAALALIPFALMLALAVAGVAIGASVLRLLAAGPGVGRQEGARFQPDASRHVISDPQTIDAEYEVKDEK